jgi:two-component system chemotaxis response regulator CheY
MAAMTTTMPTHTPLQIGSQQTKVMVVDDSMMVRQQVGHALSSAGFSIIEARDGLEALQKLDAKEDPALIVLDMNMPNMSGIELLQRMRNSSRAIPVVMLTTEGQPRLMQQAKALGARGWIIKPFKPEMLIAAVRKLTEAT